MKNRQADMPVHDQPIYAFRVDTYGQVVRETYNRYQRKENYQYPGKPAYVIPIGTHFVTKRASQMDRYLNGYLFTMDGDTFRARDIIMSYYKDKMDEAQAVVDKSKEMLTLMRAPAIPLFGGNGGGVHD